MSAKKNKDEDSERVFSYSTNPSGYNPFKDLKTETGKSSSGMKASRLRIKLERKGRGGKVVSIITGFDADPDSIDKIATQLKSNCGTGGTVKNKEILIQGDHRDKILDFLKNKGFSDVKKSGG